MIKLTINSNNYNFKRNTIYNFINYFCDKISVQCLLFNKKSSLKEMKICINFNHFFKKKNKL